MSNSSPSSQGRKTPSGRKTYKLLSIQKEMAMAHGTLKKQHLQGKREKKRHETVVNYSVIAACDCDCSGARISKNE